MFWRIKNKIDDYRFNRRMAKQRKKKGYASCDVWGMNYWLGETFSKMVRELAGMKHGYPAQLSFEEVDNFPIDWIEEESKKLEKIREKDDYEYDLFDGYDRWYLILSRIAYCLEQTNDEITEIENEYNEEYNRQVWGDDSDVKSFKQWWNKHHVVEKYDKNGKPKLYRLVTEEPEPELKEKFWKREEEIAQWREDRKNEAFDLLKKYFWALWD